MHLDRPPEVIVAAAIAWFDDLEAWSRALSRLLGEPVVVTSVATAGEEKTKAHGMTDTVQLTVRCGGHTRVAFLKTPREDMYGETLRADMARELEWRVEGYPWFTDHVRCAATGRLTVDGLTPAPSAGQPVMLEWAVPGARYADRLADPDRIGADRVALEARHICAAMVRMHRPVDGDAPSLYRRATRDSLINPIHRLLDSADSFWRGRSSLRAAVEDACGHWRLRLAQRHDRLRHVHHDFHPWNVFYDTASHGVRYIGARLPGVGDPYDDVAAFAVNYLWLSHIRHGEVAGSYRAGFESFRRAYLDLTGDEADPATMTPFLAKRLLVLLHPVYYPAMPPGTVAWLAELLRLCLSDQVDLLRGAADREFRRHPAGTAS